MTNDLKEAVEQAEKFMKGEHPNDFGYDRLRTLISHATRHAEMIEVLKGVRNAVQKAVKHGRMGYLNDDDFQLLEKQLTALSALIEGK